MPRQSIIVLYGREQGEGFLSRARAHAAAHQPVPQRCVERNATFFSPTETEPAAAVYVEARFAAVVTAYRAKGVPVLTEADLFAAEEVSHERHAPEAQEDRPHQAHEPAEGEGAAQEVVAPTPITAGRRGRRRA